MALGARGGTASRRFTFFGFFRGLAADDLIEIALGAAGRFFLEKQRELAFVELFEPISPGNMLERFFAAVAGEINSQYADVSLVPRTLHAGGLAVALFRPSAD